MSRVQILIAFIGTFHLVIMAAEMIPSCPFALRRLSARMLEPEGAELSDVQRSFVANIVKNAGIYNGIVAAALFATAYTNDWTVALVILVGVTVEGIVGAATLSPFVAVQAGLGLIGIAGLLYYGAV